MDGQTQELILSIKKDMREDLAEFREDVGKRFDKGERRFDEIEGKIDSHVAGEAPASRLSHPAVIGGGAATAIIAAVEVVKAYFTSK